MKLLQGSIHIFTDRPDLAVESFCRELKYQAKHSLAYEDIPTSSIIQYPNAVSCFCHLGLSYDYIAKIYSKKRNAPVVVCIVGRMSEPEGRESQALKLYWGMENKCIAQIETISDGQAISVKCDGMDVLKDKLDWLVLNDSVLFTSLGHAEPLSIASALSDELGVFLGGTELDGYLKKCVLRKELKLGRVYKAAQLTIK